MLGICNGIFKVTYLEHNEEVLLELIVRPYILKVISCQLCCLLVYRLCVWVAFSSDKRCYPSRFLVLTSSKERQKNLNRLILVLQCYEPCTTTTPELKMISHSAKGTSWNLLVTGQIQFLHSLDWLYHNPCLIYRFPTKVEL